MSDGIKIQGLDDLEKLRLRSQTWIPPKTLDEYLEFIKLVINTSKYTDGFMRDDLTIEDLRAYIKLKTRRILEHPDVEECVDVGAYAFMMFHKLMQSMTPREK